MHPESGDWRVLTRDRSRGYLSNLSWSHDSARIYYGRIDGAPRGILNVSALGGDERLVLEDAADPEALPDGTLLIVRVNAARQFQIHRFWPETGRLEAYPGIINETTPSRVRAFRDGNEAVFWGRSLNQPATDSNTYLYRLDLKSGEVRRFSTQDGLAFGAMALAVDPNGKFILTVKTSNDLMTVVQIPRNGGAARSLITMTDPIRYIDAAADGAIYIDQVHRPFEVVRLTSSAGLPERVLISNAALEGSARTASMSGLTPDGRIIVTTVVGGRRRLVVARPGEDPTPFAQTTEETSGPVAIIGKDEVAFVIGSGTSRKVAAASASDGRVIRRLQKQRAPGTRSFGWHARGNANLSGSSARKSAHRRQRDSCRWSHSEVVGCQLLVLGSRFAASRHGKGGPHTSALPVGRALPTWAPDDRILLFGYLDEGTLWRFNPDSSAQ